MPTPCVEAKGEKKRQANIYGIGHMASDQIRSDQIRSDQIRSDQIISDRHFTILVFENRYIPGGSMRCTNC